jgi:SOS-response transcriptional repressor LexA
MISFDDMNDRLAKLGKNRAWLVESSKRSAGAIRSALAPNANPQHRSELLQKALSDAIEREEANQATATPILLPDRITLEVPAAKFDAYSRAAADVQGRTVKEWAIEELDRAAEAWHAAQTKIRQFPSSTITSFPEVPLLRAAAGMPILADAEMVEPDRALGAGRFLLELRGDSMEPRFRDRQRVVMRDRSTLKRPVLKYGELYCFVHDGQACFKQWAKADDGRKVLRSLNPDHADIEATEETGWIGWLDPADNT